jgi:hypothetical protein
MKKYNHTITLEYERSDGTFVKFVRVADEEQNIVHLLDTAVLEFKDVVFGE